MDPYAIARRSYDTDTLITRKQFALNSITDTPISTNYITVADGEGGVQWSEILPLISTVGLGVGYLPSTIYTINSTINTISSSIPVVINSSIIGLGSSGYISSYSTIYSTINSISSSIPVIMRSSIIGLGSSGYISSFSNVTRFSSLTLNISSIGVNCNAPLFQLDVNGGGNFSTLVINGGSYPQSTTTMFALSVFGSGAVGRVGGTTWTTISDKRVKENIVEASYDRCYSDISTLSLYRYSYVSSFMDSYPLADKNVLGFIAQEVSTIQPKAIQVNNTLGIDDLQWLNMDQLNMSLYGAVKKLIVDKEILASTVMAQSIQIETLFSTLRNISA